MRILLALVMCVAAAASAAGSTTAEAAVATHDVSFSMRGDRARGWPVKTRVSLTSEASKNEWTIEAGEVRKPVSVRVPAGTYKLTIAAEHHRVFTRTLEVDKDLSLPEIALSAIPAISGLVIFRQREAEIALAGAQILAGARQLATTDEHGRFHVDLPEEDPPDAITVVHTGQAPKVVPLYENLAAENDLGTIELPRGATLTVRLDRRDDERKPLTVSVIGKLTTASHDLEPDEKEVAFSGLAPGNYRIGVKGTRPLEWMTDKVEVKEDDLEQKVAIDAFRLDGRVVVGNEALRGGGMADLLGPEGTWRAQVPIDDDGRFGGTMWQTGKVSASLKTALSPTPIVETSPDLGANPSSWNIVLKRRSIQGRVFDGQSKEPVVNARIEVVTTIGDRKMESTAAIQKDGAYSIPAIQNGRYDVRVTSPDHADSKRTMSLGRDDETPIVDFPLEGGLEAEVWFVWPNNQPVVGARVGSDDGKTLVTDKDGRVVLRLHIRETRAVAIVPREGSFAVTDVVAPRSRSMKLQVVVPLPAGSIRITSRLRSPIIVSYKGRELPQFVLQRLRSDTGEPGVVRLVHLPAGDYGVEAIGARWVQVQLNAGEQAVELVPFARRPPK
jgi:hypothetical protein